MNYYNQIKDNLIKCEIYDRAKDYLKDRNRVNVYFEIGKLVSEVGKKYNERNLRYMRQFFEIFTKIKWNPASSKWSWSHYRELLIVKDICEKNNRYVIEYCSDQRIFSREYELI